MQNFSSVSVVSLSCNFENMYKIGKAIFRVFSVSTKVGINYVPVCIGAYSLICCQGAERLSKVDWFILLSLVH